GAGGLGARRSEAVIHAEIPHRDTDGSHLASEAAPAPNAGVEAGIGDPGADAGLALQHSFEHQLADAGTNRAAADAQFRGQLHFIRQELPSLVFGLADQCTQELFDLGAERDGTLMVQLQHALLYKQKKMGVSTSETRINS